MAYITKTLSAIPLLRHRDTVVTLADQDDFVVKYEATNDHLSNTTVTELNTINSEINIIIDEINALSTNAITAIAKEALINPHYTAIDTIFANIADINAIYTNITDVGTVSDNIVSVDVLASNLEAILNTEIAVTYTYNEVIGVQGQVTFGVVYEDPNTVEVFYNGRLLSKTDWNLSGGTMLVLVSPVDTTGDIITVRTWNNFNVIDLQNTVGTITDFEAALI